MSQEATPNAVKPLTEDEVEKAVAVLRKDDPNRELYRVDVARELGRHRYTLGKFLLRHSELATRLRIKRDPRGSTPNKEEDIRKAVTEIGPHVALTTNNLAFVLDVTVESLNDYFAAHSDLKKELGVMHGLEYKYDRYLLASLRLRTSVPPFPVTYQNLADVLEEKINTVKAYMGALKRRDRPAYDRLHITLMIGKRPHQRIPLTPADIMLQHDPDKT